MNNNGFEFKVIKHIMKTKNMVYAALMRLQGSRNHDTSMRNSLEISEKVESCRKIRKEQEKSLVATCGKISLIRSLFDVCSDEGLSQSDWKKCQDRFDKYEKCVSKHLLEK